PDDVHGRGVHRLDAVPVLLRFRPRTGRRGARRPPRGIPAIRGFSRPRGARDDSRPERTRDFRGFQASLGRTRHVSASRAAGAGSTTAAASPRADAEAVADPQRRTLVGERRGAAGTLAGRGRQRRGTRAARQFRRATGRRAHRRERHDRLLAWRDAGRRPRPPEPRTRRRAVDAGDGRWLSPAPGNASNGWPLHSASIRPSRTYGGVGTRSQMRGCARCSASSAYPPIPTPTSTAGWLA